MGLSKERALYHPSGIYNLEVAPTFMENLWTPLLENPKVQHCSQDSSVSTRTRLWAGRLRNHGLIPSRVRDFVTSKMPKLDLASTQITIQWSLSQVIKQAGNVTDH